MKTLAILFGAVISSSSPADGGALSFFTGSQLYEWCKSEDLHCGSYVAGISDYLSFATALDRHIKLAYCPPKGMTVREAVLIFQGFIEKHPQLLHETAAGGVSLALTEMYPCETSN